MLIILDTNVIQADFLMRSGRFASLIDYVQKTHAKFLLRRIVHDELESNYEHDLQNHLGELTNKQKRLNRLLLKPVQQLDLDPTPTTTEYMQYVRHRLRLADSDIRDYNPNHLPELMDRAIRRKRPCTEKGEEVRDALLWLSVLDIAASEAEQVIFISQNTRQFAADIDRTTLHPDLAKEVAERKVRVQYLPSLEHFLKRHAVNVAFITKAWLAQQIDPEKVFDQVHDDALDGASAKAQSNANIDETVVAYRRSGGGLEVDEFYVYEISPGNYRVEIQWWGNIEFEYEIEHREYEYGLHQSRLAHCSQTQTTEVTVSVIVQALVEKNEVIEWDVEDSSTDVY